MLVEGIRLAEEALACRVPLDAVITSERLNRTPRGAALFALLVASQAPLWRAGDSLMDSLGDADTHQGVLLVAALPSHRLEAIIPREGAALLVVTAGVQDPGNLGALVRIAEAAGACGVASIEGADPCGPKAARASAGSIFRLPVARLTGPDAATRCLDLCRARGLALFGAAPFGGVDYRGARLPSRVGIVLGGEGHGLGEDVLRRLDGVVSIPMRSSVESLNVASAAAVILFEAARRPL